MTLPDVCLAPHEAGELAPGEPLCAPATHQVRLWNLWGNGMYLLRPNTSIYGRTEYVARRKNASDSPLLRFYSFSLNTPDVSEIIAPLRKGRFCRIIHVDAQGHLANTPSLWHLSLKLYAEGSAYWQLRGSWAVEFSWHNMRLKQRLPRAWCARTPDAEIEHDIQQMLSDPESDCAFAWRWAQLSEQEQSEIAFPVQQGTREQCESLIRAIIWSDESLDQSKAWEWSLGLGTLPDLQAGTWSTRTSELESDGASHCLTPRQSRLLELVIRNFGLHLNETIGKYTVISTWRNYNDGEFLTIKIPVPTHHERLEAHLQLRDWLQGKIAPEEIQRLLGEAR